MKYGCLIVCCMLLGACGVDVIEISLVESGVVGGAALSFPGMSSFRSSLGKKLSSKDVDANDVDSMRVKQAQMKITSKGLTEDLSFIEQFSLQVSAPGLTPAIFASKDSFSQGDKDVDLSVNSGLEFKPYLNTGSMEVQATGQLEYAPPDLVELELTIRLRVDVNVL